MSCMYLNKSHYQFVANSLYRLCTQFHRMMPYNETRKTFGEDCEERTDRILEFINRLIKHNENAYYYYYRYENRHESGSTPEDLLIDIQSLWAEINPCQLLKALECISYQCSDSPEYCESLDCKLIETIIRECRCHIIDELPEYKNAKWVL